MNQLDFGLGFVAATLFWLIALFTVLTVDRFKKRDRGKRYRTAKRLWKGEGKE